ncbi:MAG TPA: hypothetical protein VM053_06785 [Gemmatimonadaceae bacterium]|nr:hypothetical protein [Gemmatimonadaceae bacterium]
MELLVWMFMGGICSMLAMGYVSMNKPDIPDSRYLAGKTRADLDSRVGRAAFAVFVIGFMFGQCATRL